LTARSEPSLRTMRRDNSDAPTSLNQDNPMMSAVGAAPLLGMFATWFKPLWTVAVGVVAAMAVLWIVSLVVRLIAPKVWAIARTTAKETLSQPLFFVVLGAGLFALLVFPFIPYNTFGEDVKMLKTVGMTLIKLLAIFLGLWTASVSISDEIEGRTALTLLSKPIGRAQLILGKFLGVLVPVVLVFVVLGGFFLCTISYKVVYDSRETANPEPAWQDCAKEMLDTTPGLALAFMEAVVLSSIAVAISTRLSIVPNLVICLSIYLLGNLVPRLVNSDVGRFEIVNFVGRFLAAILPVLDHFSVESIMFRNQPVPWHEMANYLALAGLYCVLYSTVAMLVALLLFEDRDLA
jgi:ABC-type transport system involved in multi-copper enzyme maturation permease subunit